MLQSIEAVLQTRSTSRMHHRSRQAGLISFLRGVQCRRGHSKGESDSALLLGRLLRSVQNTTASGDNCRRLRSRCRLIRSAVQKFISMQVRHSVLPDYTRYVFIMVQVDIAIASTTWRSFIWRGIILENVIQLRLCIVGGCECLRLTFTRDSWDETQANSVWSGRLSDIVVWLKDIGR